MKLSELYTREFRFSMPGESRERVTDEVLFSTYVRDQLEYKDAEFWSLATMEAHAEQGAQIWVSRRVSDDLQRSDIPEPDFTGVEWPMPSLEFVFEDPDIPGFLMRNNAITGIDDWVFKRIRPLMVANNWGVPEVDGRPPLVAMMACHGNGIEWAFVLKTAEAMNNFAAHWDAEDYAAGDDFETYPDEAKGLSQMALLAFKVLLFAGVPQYKAVKTMDPPTRREGGKPGFMGRPRTPRFIVTYLPKQILELQREAMAARKSHDFKGRRGHLLTYRNERYVRVRWQTRFMPPIPDPHGNYPRRVFKVVK